MNPQPSTHNSQLAISVIICTHNRADSLRRTLQSLCNLTIPEGVEWELLLVNNGSTDHTPSVCEEFSSRLPLCCFTEPRPGLGFARNSGIEKSRGSLLLFSDDDVTIDAAWLAAYSNAARRYPNFSFFGGKVLPRWDSPPPRWAVENLGWLPTNVHIDRGPHELVLSELPANVRFFPGCNLAIRRNVFAGDVRFRKDVGPCGDGSTGISNIRGEEVELENRLMATGHDGVYIPSAIVYHWHPASRQTERYVRLYHYGAAIGEVRIQGLPANGKYWFGAPRYLWKILLVSTAQYLFTRPWAQSRAWLSAETIMASTWGAISEYRRLAQQHSNKHKTEFIAHS